MTVGEAVGWLSVDAGQRGYLGLDDVSRRKEATRWVGIYDVRKAMW